MLGIFYADDTRVIRLTYAPRRRVSFVAHPVELINIHRRFGSTLALAGVDFHASAGNITAVLGPNGAGKTTMLEICEGLQHADSGQVKVLGMDPIADASKLRPRVGVMIQDGGLPLSAKAGELLKHVSTMYAAPADIAELREELGLEDFVTTQVRHLSGGMRQRLAMAVALVGRPEVVFLDEPSAGLDPAARREVWDIISRIKQRGTTIILTSHLMDEVEYLADYVYIMNAGKVIAQGSVDALTSVESSSVPTSVRLTGRISQQDYQALSDWAQQRELTLTPRSLEDVFLDLTGRMLR